MSNLLRSNSENTNLHKYTRIISKLIFQSTIKGYVSIIIALLKYHLTCKPDKQLISNTRMSLNKHIFELRTGKYYR